MPILSGSPRSISYPALPGRSRRRSFSDGGARRRPAPKIALAQVEPTAPVLPRRHPFRAAGPNDNRASTIRPDRKSNRFGLLFAAPARTLSIQMDYEANIGLETHVQLKTRTKMWCGCANRYGEPPNTLVCPVCLGLPGALPVANEEALRLTALTGLMLQSELPRHVRFDRKNYFYPDMPKNYQITQMTHPSTVGGKVEFEFEGRTASVRITRAHLEEDVGKSFHFDQFSGVDFNRAGVPLMEIVSEPDLHSAGMAYAYLHALVAILTSGEISDCDLEKGMVRCDVNISVRPPGTTRLGAKIEIKNMNSFRGIRRAIEYEIERQCQALDRGEKLRQETRRWNDESAVTEPMRLKEDAHDYRYFPDPDLMPFELDDAWVQAVAERTVELPLARKRRLIADYDLPPEDADTLVRDRELADGFESLAPEASSPKKVANWLINNLKAKLTETGRPLNKLPFDLRQLNRLIELIDRGTINSRIAQKVFAEMFATGTAPEKIVADRGLAQVSDTGAIATLCDQVIEEHPKSVADYCRGKKAALNFLNGQVMRLSRGKANPQQVKKTLETKLAARQPPASP